MQGVHSYIKKKQKKVVFADGEDENTLKAAIAFKNSELGIPILVGKEELIKNQIKNLGYSEDFDIEIVNSKDKVKREKYVKYLFKKLQRNQGLLEWDCDRLVRNDRVIWASCMVACGDADGAVTGNTRRFGASLEKIKQVESTIEFRNKQLEAAITNNPDKVDVYKRNIKSLEDAMQGYIDEVTRIEASAIWITIFGIALLISIKIVQGILANSVLEKRYSEWLSDKTIRPGMQTKNFISSTMFAAVIMFFSVV